MARSAIHRAIEHGTPRDLRAALAAEGDPQVQNKWRDYPIELAARNANPAFTRILLAAGANPNSKSTVRSPLMAAAERGYIDNVRALLDAGARIDARGMNQRTALGFAASCKREAVVVLLLKRGANASLAETGGTTPLMHSAVSRSPAAARALIDAGARLDAKDEQGWTALMWAAMRGCLPVVKVLCEAGADWRLKDRRKQSALQLAEADRRSAVVKHLRGLGD
jgi:ankyrin repeat protein